VVRGGVERIGGYEWRKGDLSHIALRSAPLHFAAFTGQVTCRDGKLVLKDGRMTAHNGFFEVSGTASFARELALNFRGSGGSFEVSGTLDKPKVAEAAAEQSKSK
jgi:hypothetical protein